MAELLEQLIDNGFKITPQRRMILDILKKSSRHLTAEEIANEVKKIQPSVSVATVYRNLNLMVDISLLNRFKLHNGPARYQINQGHNHHLICMECGETVSLDICPMQEKITQLIDEIGFKVDDHYFEITGICKDCQVNSERKE